VFPLLDRNVAPALTAPIPLKNRDRPTDRGAVGTVPAMASDPKIEHLAKVRMFSALNKKELSLVSKASDVVKVGAGTQIVTEGTVGHEFYLITHGTAEVKRGGRKVATLAPGDYFGEMAILDRGPRSATVVAASDMELIVIGQREFLGVLEQVPAVTHKLLVSMAARHREADTRALSY